MLVIDLELKFHKAIHFFVAFYLLQSFTNPDSWGEKVEDAPNPTPSSSALPLAMPSSSPSSLPSPSTSSSPFKSGIPTLVPMVTSSNESKTPPVHKRITIQIGTYTTLRKAALMRSILKDLTQVDVERIQGEDKETLYRVLVGNFKSIEEANHFMKTYRLNDLFKGVWVNSTIVEIPNERPGTIAGGEIISSEMLEQDPFFVQLDLHCQNGKKYGVYKAELHPDEKDANRDIDLNVHWNCIPEPTERWLAKDEERSPSNFSIGALVGAGSLAITDNTIGSTGRTDFSYGFQVGGFRSFGGMGPTFEYRFIDHRYNGSASTISPEFYISHRLLVGARLPITHRFEFQPLLGFYTQAFLQGASDATATLVDPLLTQAALRFTFHLLELDQQAWFDLIGSYHYLFPATTPIFTLSSGYEYSFKIQTSSFFPDGFGINWFMEFSSRSMTSTTFVQTDTLFLVGVSALIGF